MGNIAYNNSNSEQATRAQETARLLSALANPLRLRILRQLLDDTSCVTDFVQALGVDQPKVSQHLAVLRQSGIIRCRAEGRKRCYSVTRPELLRELLGSVQALWLDLSEVETSEDQRCIEP